LRRRLPIRLRLAIASVALVLLVLLLTGAGVVILERRSLNESLAQEATLEARSLLAVASQAEPGSVPTARTDGGGDGKDDDDGDEDEAVVPDLNGGGAGDTDPAAAPALAELDASTEPYLVRRSAADNLLAVRAPGAAALINTEDARGLVPYLDDPAGTTTGVLDDDGYTIAVARDANGVTAAAGVPREQADDRLAELVRALLVAGGVGAALTLLGSWFAARSALRPLTTMSRRAESITAGRLEARVGPIGGDDEIARLTHSIDDMLERLETAFLAQQRFVQDASHELRTPITIARGHLEVTDPLHEDSATVKAAIDLAVDELARMGQLVERLLVLARAGELPAGRLRAVPCNALGEAALVRVRGNPERRWELRSDPADPAALVDHDALVDVLVNLLRNAERHTASGGLIRIVVDADPTHVTIAVEDDGEGISAELLPVIFDRFTRADAARTRDAGGAGLGLAISRALVEAHGGTLTVASVLGAGATFTIRLPRSD
jgi:signal transduction histidine kinase